ncbi:MAG: hypothetical protein F4X39_09475 [Acidobacteriia bacterium]|nr:hypothetical protein [Terriglobia bacterium]
MDMNPGLAAFAERLDEAFGKRGMNVVYYVIVACILATLVGNTLILIVDIGKTVHDSGRLGQIAYTFIIYLSVGAATWGYARWLVNRSIKRIKKNTADVQDRLDKTGAYLEERHKRWIAAYREFQTLLHDFKEATGGKVSLDSVVAELEDQDAAPPRS